MVTPILLAGLGALALSKGKGGKGKKIFDLTTGIVGNFIVGVGAGAVVNALDSMVAGGQLTRIGIGVPGLRSGLNLTDAATVAMTVGLPTSKKIIAANTLATLAGKKVAENFGLINIGIPAVSSTGTVTQGATR